MELLNNNFIFTGFIIFILLIALIVTFMPKFENNKLIQFLGISLIIFLTFISKAEWCFLLLTIYIALKLKIIDENLLTEISDLQNARSGNYKKKRRNNEDKDIINTGRIEEVKLTTDDTNVIKSNSIINEYRNSEKDIINWFALNKNFIFESNLKVVANEKTIYPDGLNETDSQINILEIKHCFKDNKCVRLLKYGLETLQKNKNFYQYSQKDINLYLAIVLNDRSYISVIKDHLKKYDSRGNLCVYIFQQGNDGIQLAENIDV